MHHDFAEQRQHRLGARPDPTCQVLAGGIFQARNLVQQLMIDALEHRLKRCAYLGEIHHPPGMRIDRARNVQLDAKGMPMQARALVPRRHIRQAMSGFDGEGAKDLHAVRLKLPRRDALMPRAQDALERGLTHDHAALRRRELDAQLQVPHVQRIELQSPQTVKSTEPK